MSGRNTAADSPPAKTWKLDGTIPVWGLLLILFSLCSTWVGYSYTTMQDQKDRILVLETTAVSDRAKILEMNAKLQTFDTLKQDVGTLKELMIRVERKLDTLTK